MNFDCCTHLYDVNLCQHIEHYHFCRKFPPAFSQSIPALTQMQPLLMSPPWNWFCPLQKFNKWILTKCALLNNYSFSQHNDLVIHSFCACEYQQFAFLLLSSISLFGYNTVYPFSYCQTSELCSILAYHNKAATSIFINIIF